MKKFFSLTLLTLSLFVSAVSSCVANGSEEQPGGTEVQSPEERLREKLRQKIESILAGTATNEQGEPLSEAEIITELFMRERLRAFSDTFSSLTELLGLEKRDEWKKVHELLNELVTFGKRYKEKQEALFAQAGPPFEDPHTFDYFSTHFLEEPEGFGWEDWKQINDYEAKLVHAGHYLSLVKKRSSSEADFLQKWGNIEAFLQRMRLKIIEKYHVRDKQRFNTPQRNPLDAAASIRVTLERAYERFSTLKSIRGDVTSPNVARAFDASIGQVQEDIKTYESRYENLIKTTNPRSKAFKWLLHGSAPDYVISASNKEGMLARARLRILVKNTLKKLKPRYRGDRESLRKENQFLQEVREKFPEDFKKLPQLLDGLPPPLSSEKEKKVLRDEQRKYVEDILAGIATDEVGDPLKKSGTFFEIANMEEFEKLKKMSQTAAEKREIVELKKRYGKRLVELGREIGFSGRTWNEGLLRMFEPGALFTADNKALLKKVQTDLAAIKRYYLRENEEDRYFADWGYIEEYLAQTLQKIDKGEEGEPFLDWREASQHGGAILGQLKSVESKLEGNEDPILYRASSSLRGAYEAHYMLNAVREMITSPTVASQFNKLSKKNQEQIEKYEREYKSEIAEAEGEKAFEELPSASPRLRPLRGHEKQADARFYAFAHDVVKELKPELEVDFPQEKKKFFQDVQKESGEDFSKPLPSLKLHLSSSRERWLKGGAITVVVAASLIAFLTKTERGRRWLKKLKSFFKKEEPEATEPQVQTEGQGQPVGVTVPVEPAESEDVVF